ncbi:MAG: hypothetical protein ACERJ2_07880 [Filomicrobium sp.]
MFRNSGREPSLWLLVLGPAVCFFGIENYEVIALDAQAAPNLGVQKASEDQWQERPAH